VRALLSLKKFAKSRFLQLKQIRADPHTVAAGAANGIFWSFTPLLGIKTLLSILSAWAFRLSKVSSVIAVTAPDLLTPIWPIILRWEYDAGFWMQSHPHHFPKRFHVGNLALKELLHFRTLKILWPTFLGSLLFAMPLALLSYWLVKRWLERAREKRQVPRPLPA
jgi:uncharacterized protein